MELATVLLYRNPELVDAFAENTGLSFEDSCDIFEEMKKFLYLCAVRGDKERIFINDPLVIVDEMWHEFITRTLEYNYFCDEFLGKFIHHVPVTRAEREEANNHFISDPEGYRASRKRMFLDFYRAIISELGRATLYKWQVMYREKYSPDIRDKFNRSTLSIKNRTISFPVSEKNFQSFESILYGHERDDESLIEEIASIEMRMTSRWPNHSCGGTVPAERHAIKNKPRLRYCTPTGP